MDPINACLSSEKYVHGICQLASQLAGLAVSSPVTACVHTFLPHQRPVDAHTFDDADD
jgi:hypothetical protein